MKSVLFIGVRLAFLLLGFMLITSSVQLALGHRTKHVVKQPLDTPRYIEKQLACLSKNIYWEASGEPFEGKVAVAQVTMNRVASGQFANSVCDVVYQKNTFFNKTICQFSWFCERNHITKTISTESFKECEDVAKMVLLEGFRIPSLRDALYYHADYVDPKWKKQRIAKIGRHVFYKDRT